MQKVEIWYYPSKIKTAIEIDKVNIYGKPNNYERFINILEMNVPLREWAGTISDRWKGLVNELREDNNGFEVINISFHGKKADFEDLRQICEAENEKRKEKLEINFLHETEALDERVCQNIHKIMKLLCSEKFVRILLEEEKAQAKETSGEERTAGEAEGKETQAEEISIAEAYRELKDKYAKEQAGPFLTRDFKNSFDKFAGEVKRLTEKEGRLLRQKEKELQEEKSENVMVMLGKSMRKIRIKELQDLKREAEEQEKIAGGSCADSREIQKIEEEILTKEREIHKLEKLIDKRGDRIRKLLGEAESIREKLLLLLRLKAGMEQAENPKWPKKDRGIPLFDRKFSPKYANSRGIDLSGNGGRYGGRKRKTRAAGSERK
ncbi:MAG: hypothetical protein NC400_11015 [Clostridium sp.]|nr:hypothetical protein [Clostridium sp.]